MPYRLVYSLWACRIEGGGSIAWLVPRFGLGTKIQNTSPSNGKSHLLIKYFNVSIETVNWSRQSSVCSLCEVSSDHCWMPLAESRLEVLQVRKLIQCVRLQDSDQIAKLVQLGIPGLINYQGESCFTCKEHGCEWVCFMVQYPVVWLCRNRGINKLSSGGL